MAAVFQNMFPSLDVKNMKLKNCRRVVLLRYDPTDDTIDMRHYVVNCSIVGVNKKVKDLVKVSGCGVTLATSLRFSFYGGCVCIVAYP
jgi:hypothetical protein